MPDPRLLDPVSLLLYSRVKGQDRTGIQGSEPAAVARGQKCGAGVKSLRTAEYA